MQRAVDQAEARWDTRIYPGINVAAVPGDVREQLAHSLGALGVEAEFALALIAPFTRGVPNWPTTREAGERFLWQLDALGRRLIGAAGDLEVATQSYLSNLEAQNPDLRPPLGQDGTWADEMASPWWPAVDTSQAGDGPIELSMRRCGYAYRHVVAAHLATNVAGIAEQLSLVLHALNTLPPAGTVPQASLYAGLYELSEGLQGHMVPHNLRDVSPEAPGLLTGIALVRRLDATEDRSIDADLGWTRAQLAELELVAAHHAGAPSAATDGARRGLLGLFRRKASGASAIGNKTSAAAFTSQASREWTDTIAALEALRRQAHGTGAR